MGDVSVVYLFFEGSRAKQGTFHPKEGEHFLCRQVYMSLCIHGVI